MLVTPPRDVLDTLLPVMLEEYSSVILIGPPGTGKSTLAYNTSAQMVRSFFKVASHPDATFGELVMGAMPYGGQWRTLAMPVLRAFGYDVDPVTNTIVRVDNGGLLCLDDIHMAGPGMVATMYTALDSGIGGAVTLPDGTRATPGANYACVATMNGSVEDLDPAVRDRAIAVVPVLSPSTDMFNLLHPLCRVLAQADYNGKRLQPVATFREWYSVSKLWKRFGSTPGISREQALSYAATAALGDGKHAHVMLETLASVDVDIFSGQYKAHDALQWHVSQ